MAVDPTFGINAFNRTKILTEKETLVNNFLCLLFATPGFYPSIPSLGFDIKRYMNMFESDIDPELMKAEVVEMCSDFIPEVNDGSFDIMIDHYGDKPFIVFILPTIDDGKEITLALGVTVNANGEFLYKFIENKYQTI